MNDDEAIALIADGSLYGLEHLYNNTYKQVYVFILSITKCRQVAEDLLQDTYIRILQNAKSYQQGTNARTWVMTIAKNLTYDYFRKTKRLVPLDNTQIQNDLENVNDISTRLVDHMTLEAALKRLSDIDAQIAILYAVCGYKHREIALILSIPEGTIRRRYMNAIRQLAKEMGGNIR